MNSAQADITYSGPLNQPFADTDPSQAVRVLNSFTLGAGGSFALLHNLRSNGGFAGFLVSGVVSGQFLGKAVGAYRYVSRLASNQQLLSATPFIAGNSNFFATLANRAGFTSSKWLTPGNGFIGFRFDSGAGQQYGWVRLTMNSGAPNNTFTLVDYAYAGVGESIRTGQTAVPEPGSLALLALGGVGLLAWRKRRAKAAVQA